MVQLPPEFRKHQQLQANPSPFLWLFQLNDPNGGPVYDEEGQVRVVRATANPVAVQHSTDSLTGNPLAWYPWDIEFGELPSAGDGSIKGMSLAIGNRGGYMQRLLDRNNGLHRHRVTMHLVHADELGSASAKLTVPLRAHGVEVTWDAVVLTLSSPNVNDANLPADLITRSCRSRYRGPQCGFAGDPENALGQCAKSLAACKVRGQWAVDNGLATSLFDAPHPLRFGGFPALPVGSFLG